MNIEFNKLPRKAYFKKQSLQDIIGNSDDKLYSILSVDYQSGMIRFQSLYYDNLFINLYTTSFTITLEIREENDRNRQFHLRKLSAGQVKRVFNNPKKYKYKNTLKYN